MGALLIWVGRGARSPPDGWSRATWRSSPWFSAMFVAPLFQLVDVSTQLMEASAGLERTREVLDERPEDADPRRTHEMGPIEGHVVFDDVLVRVRRG